MSEQQEEQWRLEACSNLSLLINAREDGCVTSAAERTHQSNTQHVQSRAALT